MSSLIGGGCSITHCKNYFYRSNSDVSFFGFPKDETIRKIWLARCKGRLRKVNLQYARVCSKHFLPDDIVRDFQAELTGQKRKRRLKPGAVPSLRLSATKEDSPEPTSPSPEERQQNSKKLVERLLKEHDEKEKETEKELIAQQKIDAELDAKKMSALKKELEEWKEKHSTLSVNYMVLKNKYDELERSNNLLNSTVSKLEKDIFIQKQQLNAHKQLEKCYRNGLSKVFTRNQIDMLLHGKKHPKKWPLEDINIAFTIRYLSKKCYNYLKYQLNFPLPAISSLKRWASTMNMKSELLEGVLQLMQIASANKLTEFERICVLYVDEMTVRNGKEKSKQTDKAEDNYCEMTVLMARGLFSQWKQPLYVEFDVDNLRTILHYIIDELHDINYSVMAIVCKPSEKNQTLWSDLGATPEMPYFEQCSQKIFCFPDSQYLLKVLRDHFIDSGFVLGSGQIITKAPLEELVECNAELEVDSISKLGKFHITVPQHRRNDLRCATDLFSRSTVSELKRYIVGVKEERLSLMKFINEASDWSEMVNSNSPRQNFGGKDFKRQESILNCFKDTISSLKVTSEKDVLPFQNHIVMSINALILMFEFFQSQCSVKCIQTNKVNLGCMETLFFQMKNLSRHAVFLDSKEALNCLRAVTMNENSVNDSSGEDFLIQQVLRKATTDDADSMYLLSSDDSEEDEENSEMLLNESDDE